MTYNDPNVPSDAERPAPVRPPFRPQPPRFWQIVLKDVAVTVVGVTLFCFLCFMIFVGAVGLLAGSLGSVGAEKSSLAETTIQGSDSSEGKIVILPIEGVIETDETGFVPEAIDTIRDDKRVRAVVLRVNSPGGTISGSDYYLHLLKKLKAEREIPVIVSMGDMAASGGYYVSTVGDKIFAERSTVTGSIGVIISMYNAAELCKKLGVRSNAITSGAMKGMGDFMKEPTPEETAIWQKSVDDSYEQFLEVVKEGRAYYRGEEGSTTNEPRHERLAGVKVKTIDETAEDEPVANADEELANDEETRAAESDQAEEGAAETLAAQEENKRETPADAQLDVKAQREAELRALADGRIYSAQDAKDLRLIDEIGFLDDAIDEAIKSAGLSPKNVQVVRYEEEKGLFDSLVSIKAKREPLDKVLDAISSPKGYYICPRMLP